MVASRILTVLLDLFDIPHYPHWFSVRVVPGIIGIQAFHVGEQKQVIGVDDGRRDGREGVVVAETDFLNGQADSCWN